MGGGRHRFVRHGFVQNRQPTRLQGNHKQTIKHSGSLVLDIRVCFFFLGQGVVFLPDSVARNGLSWPTAPSRSALHWKLLSTRGDWFGFFQVSFRPTCASGLGELAMIAPLNRKISCMSQNRLRSELGSVGSCRMLGASCESVGWKKAPALANAVSRSFLNMGQQQLTAFHSPNGHCQTRGKDLLVLFPAIVHASMARSM